MTSKTPPCPCGTGLAYAQCCEPLHRGAREAADAEALMRSRFSAFAKGEAEHLWRTLHPDHPDRARPKDEALRALRHAARTYRYVGLAVLDRAAPDGGGVARVLFRARVFLKGRDVGFAECSEFARDGEGWRYLSGVTVGAATLREGDADVTIAAFLGRHAPTRPP